MYISADLEGITGVASADQFTRIALNGVSMSEADTNAAIAARYA